MPPITEDSHFSHVRPVTTIQRLFTDILTALVKDPQRPQTQGRLDIYMVRQTTTRGCQKILQFAFRTLLLGWMRNNAAAISWPVAELMNVQIIIRCCDYANSYELLRSG